LEVPTPGTGRLPDHVRNEAITKREQIVAVVRVDQESDAGLLQVGEVCGLLRLHLRLSEDGEQDGREDRDNSDDDK